MKVGEGGDFSVRKVPSLALPPEKTGMGKLWGRGRFSKRSASPPAPLSRRVAGVRVGFFLRTSTSLLVGRGSPISLVVVTAALSAAVTSTPKQGHYRTIGGQRWRCLFRHLLLAEISIYLQ